MLISSCSHWLHIFRVLHENVLQTILNQLHVVYAHKRTPYSAMYWNIDVSVLHEYLKQEASRSIETDESKDLAGCHHAKLCSVPAEQLETVVDGEGTGYVEGDNEDGVDTEEEQDHACYHKAQKEHEKLCSLPPLCPS